MYNLWLLFLFERLNNGWEIQDVLRYVWFGSISLNKFNYEPC